ncbi:MAG: hypothetical protein WC476_01395 [Phycisphaerae bacterium]|jgi:predicted phosphodiesterase
MIINEFTIYYDNIDENFVFVPFGDFHLGCVDFDRIKWEETVDFMVNSPNCYTMIMGDEGDFVLYTDQRYDPKCVEKKYREGQAFADPVGCQYQEIKDALMPMKGRILGVHEGNHEHTIRRDYLRDITLDLAREWEAKPLSFTAMTRLTFAQKRKNPRQDRNEKVEKSIKYNIYSTHGSGTSTTTGSKINRIEKLTKSFDADIYLYAHTHLKLITDSQRKLGLSKTGNCKLVDSNKIFALTGGYLKQGQDHDSHYSERKGYEPLQTGSPALLFFPGKQRVELINDVLDLKNRRF